MADMDAEGTASNAGKSKIKDGAAAIQKYKQEKDNAIEHQAGGHNSKLVVVDTPNDHAQTLTFVMPCAPGS